MPRPPSQNRARIAALHSQGLSQAEIAAQLGLSRKLVVYYLGPQGNAPPLDSPPPPVAGDAPSSDHALDTLKRLLDERDNAKSSSDRIRASEAILRNLSSLAGDTDWSPPEDVWTGFLREAVATLPPDKLRNAPARGVQRSPEATPQTPPDSP